MPAKEELSDGRYTKGEDAWKNPIHNLCGSRFLNFLVLLSRYNVDRSFAGRAVLSGFLSMLISLIGIPDRIIMWWRRSRLKPEPPVFIIGHWRSGTTLLHNLFCLDPRNGFTSTYQVIFPNNMVLTKPLLKWFMKLFMPAARPVDHVLLDPEYPQEEEMAIGNLIPTSFYNWMYFPKQTALFRDSFLDLQSLSTKQYSRWIRTYHRLLMDSLAATRRNRYVSKNPPNTARIPILLKQYPGARFVYLVRNPYEVIQSSNDFFRQTLKLTRLQHYPMTALHEEVFETYDRLLNAYEQDKARIPEGHLAELRYENFMNDPVACMNQLYNQFSIDIPASLQSAWEHYGKAHPARAKTRHTVHDEELETEQRIGKWIRFYGYHSEVSLKG